MGVDFMRQIWPLWEVYAGASEPGPSLQISVLQDIFASPSGISIIVVFERLATIAYPSTCNVNATK